jgi:hypothetical protein
MKFSSSNALCLRSMVIDGKACFSLRELSRQAEATLRASLSCRWFDANRCLPRDCLIAKRAREFLWPFGVADLFSSFSAKTKA